MDLLSTFDLFSTFDLLFYLRRIFYLRPLMHPGPTPFFTWDQLFYPATYFLIWDPLFDLRPTFDLRPIFWPETHFFTWPTFWVDPLFDPRPTFDLRPIFWPETHFDLSLIRFVYPEAAWCWNYPTFGFHYSLSALVQNSKPSQSCSLVRPKWLKCGCKSGENTVFRQFFVNNFFYKKNLKNREPLFCSQ